MTDTNDRWDRVTAAMQSVTPEELAGDPKLLADVDQEEALKRELVKCALAAQLAGEAGAFAEASTWYGEMGKLLSSLTPIGLLSIAGTLTITVAGYVLRDHDAGHPQK